MSRLFTEQEDNKGGRPANQRGYQDGYAPLEVA